MNERRLSDSNAVLCYFKMAPAVIVEKYKFHRNLMTIVHIVYKQCQKGIAARFFDSDIVSKWQPAAILETRSPVGEYTGSCS